MSNKTSEPRRKLKSKRIGTPPEGLSYRAGFLSDREERDMSTALSRLTLKPVFMRGVTSLRRVAHFGWDYHYDGWNITPAEEIPHFIRSVVPRVAAFCGAMPEALEQVLVSYYPAGAGIGWHRDAPMFGEPVVGLSFRAACPIRFRRKTPEGYEVYEQVLDPGSIYSLSGPARADWQHGILRAPLDRYSVTFRTLKRRPDVPSEILSLTEPRSK